MCSISCRALPFNPFVRSAWGAVDSREDDDPNEPANPPLMAWDMQQVGYCNDDISSLLGMPSRVLIMLSFDSHVQNSFVIVPLCPCLLQPPHFVVFQASPNGFLQLFPTDLLLRLRLFVRFQSRLEACLHPYSQRCIEGYRFSIPTNFRTFNCIHYYQKFLPSGLDIESSSGIRRWYTEKGLLRRDGLMQSREDARLVAAQVTTP